MAGAASSTHARFARLLAAKPRIILGSASKSRRSIMDELAERHGFAYEVLTADIDEKAVRRDTPEALVVALAHAKADAILERLRKGGDEGGSGGDAYLITCDQVRGRVCACVRLMITRAAWRTRARKEGASTRRASKQASSTT
jgi:predicted house-cleaning NTP pyrophosphatase (Maf/HAM1 superfamily)